MIRWRVTWTENDEWPHSQVVRADTAAQAAWQVALEETRRGFSDLTLINVHPT